MWANAWISAASRFLIASLRATFLSVHRKTRPLSLPQNLIFTGTVWSGLMVHGLAILDGLLALFLKKETRHYK